MRREDSTTVPENTRTPVMTADELYSASRAYYNRNAQRYESASWYYLNRYKATAVRRELLRALSLLGVRPRISVLEIGPGTGYLLASLLDLTECPIHYTCFEHSQEMARILSERHAHRCAEFVVLSRSVNRDVVSAFSERLRFDLVIGSSILHHLPDYEEVVKGLAALLRPGGVMYFVREPIHRDECARPGLLAQLSDLVFGSLNWILMTKVIRAALWPTKVKAEDASMIAVQMTRDGVSTRVFLELESEGCELITVRKYNRRVSSFLSFAENSWFAPFRRDIFGNTLYSVLLQKNVEVN